MSVLAETVDAVRNSPKVWMPGSHLGHEGHPEHIFLMRKSISSIHAHLSTRTTVVVQLNQLLLLD
jgi:hypothetical protein